MNDLYGELNRWLSDALATLAAAGHGPVEWLHTRFVPAVHGARMARPHLDDPNALLHPSRRQA
ncbi:hypothetical protein [Mesorhizobium sp. M2A.F.Ca.ET.043.02.1.1]|uniref:hypothetical protein n=1 Tax=Mesorhizobium sp. M2A.F.Ca.ET.043.02.1.1 TaxID=2493670 RepID=UPI000F75ABF4|nr:hypothetical protein [Mesorhizobium sp. M2A.F.Ca.ET.043.02.1.1]AZO07187.1 hypothetical protein EJ068_32080 [Mesorhizobium sp. M2A.F.Ca.ET.043.02.1.1]